MKSTRDLQQSADNEENIEPALTIIDGEKFLEENKDGKFNDLRVQLNQIKDAAADIALCEVINEESNVERRGGWLDFIDGKGLPPREEFIRSHRTGNVHGTKIFLPIVPPKSLEVDETITNPRIMVDPILTRLCESLMPEFGSKEIVVEVSTIDDAHTSTCRPLTLFARELKMHPIDLVIGGVEELQLRIRYYVLSCWSKNDSSDLAAPSACNILGKFPDFETSDELLNEVGITIVRPVSDSDTLSIFSCIDKAKYIKKLIHNNQRKNGQGTVHPNDIPIVTQEQLEHLDSSASFELLSKRLKTLMVHLVELVTTTVKATSELKRRHFILLGLKNCRRTLQRVIPKIENGEDRSIIINQCDLKLSNFMNSDPELMGIAEHVGIKGQFDDVQQGLLHSEEDMRTLLQTLISGLLKIESEFGVHIQNSASDLILNSGLPLFEMSQFGLEKALTIFPERPSVDASFKIAKIIDQLITSLIDKLGAAVKKSANFYNHLQCLKVVYLNASEVNQIFVLCDLEFVADKLRSRLPLSEEQINILIAIQFQGSSYFGPMLDKLVDQTIALGIAYEFTGNDYTTEDIVNLLQAVTDKEGMVILTPYFLCKNNGIRPDWEFDFSKMKSLSGESYLQQYQDVRQG